MCGIAGLVASSPQRAEHALGAMVAAQTHRGPDDEGRELFPLADDRWLALGHRRLSIIDVSAAGHQPMVHPETGDVLVYNGELYNFQELRKELLARGREFQGHSDTEVLLHAIVEFGMECLKRVAGMYAFAFFRRVDQTLILARDPLGIKPLYLGEGPEGLVFASEVRAIRAARMLEDRLDERAVAGLIAYGSVQEPLTICRGIRAFPPGSYLEIPLDRQGEVPWHRVTNFWRMARPDPTVSLGDAVDHLSESLDLAVKQHLISDVPVGVFLSSGLDSTIIAGLAAQYSPRLRTLTVGFADQKDMSEAELARDTASGLGVEHTEIQITNVDAERAALEWLEHIDQPSLDGLNTFVISKKTRELGIVVALNGLGGDELFGGYDMFADVPRYQRLLQRFRWVPPAMRARALSMVGRLRSQTAADKAAAIGGADPDLLQLCLHRRRVVPDYLMHQLGFDSKRLGLHSMFVPNEAVAAVDILDQDPIWTVAELESRFYMLNTLLRDSDANGMASSIEIRVPMLDRRVADLACSLPGNVRLPGGQAKKQLLRMAFGRFLRPALLQQKKRGFTLPIRRWMLGPLRPLCEEAVAHVRDSGLVRPEGVKQIWESFLKAPETPAWSRAFTLVILGIYARRTVPCHPLTHTSNI